LALLSQASATMTPLPTVAGLPSKGLITETIGVFGAVAHAMNVSISMPRFAPSSARSAS